MIGRLVTFEGTQSAVVNLEQGLMGENIDALKALPGLHGLHVMLDREGGKAVVLAIWEDQQSADGAMDAMVPIRRKIIESGLSQSMHDYQVIA